MYITAFLRKMAEKPPIRQHLPFDAASQPVAPAILDEISGLVAEFKAAALYRLTCVSVEIDRSRKPGVKGAYAGETDG